MNSVTKYVLGIVALAGAIFFSWYFFSVIVYILVAAVISFIGRPIIDLLGRVKIRGYRLPDGLKAGITVICLWGLFILFFSTIIPLAIREFQSLGNVSVSNIVSELESPIEDAGHFMKHYGLMDEDQDVDAYVTDLLSKVFNVGQLKTWFGTVAGTMTDIFVALFSITFILFFFLKDSRLFSGMVMAASFPLRRTGPECFGFHTKITGPLFCRIIARSFGGYGFEYDRTDDCRFGL